MNTTPETQTPLAVGNGEVLHLNTRSFSDRAQLVPFRPPQNPEEAAAHQERLQALVQAAAADHHQVVAPTHAVIKGETIVGYASMAGLPTMHVWLDSTRVHAGESLRLLETALAVMADKGVRAVCVPCGTESPFAAHMERLGFTKLGPTVLYVRSL